MVMIHVVIQDFVHITQHYCQSCNEVIQNYEVECIRMTQSTARPESVARPELSIQL